MKRRGMGVYGVWSISPAASRDLGSVAHISRRLEGPDLGCSIASLSSSCYYILTSNRGFLHRRGKINIPLLISQHVFCWE